MPPPRLHLAGTKPCPYPKPAPALEEAQYNQHRLARRNLPTARWHYGCSSRRLLALVRPERRCLRTRQHPARPPAGGRRSIKAARGPPLGGRRLLDGGRPPLDGSASGLDGALEPPQAR